MRLIIVSGRSGSGKSISLHVLEDLGFYCIDNLPISLLPAMVDQVGALHSNVAVGVDARNLVTELLQFDAIMKQIKNPSHNCEVLYLDADEETLLKRFSETRRKHPLSNQNTSLQEALEKEKKLLDPIAEMADLRVDTSRLTLHQLRDKLYKQLKKEDAKTLSLLFQSFGYKFGVPRDTDYVFDVRCLPNPYWEVGLRSSTGLDPAIEDYLLSHEITRDLLDDIKSFLLRWVPKFSQDKRNYLSVAIGCTGGQHRSVFMSEHLAEYFRQQQSEDFNCHIQVRHRELL